MNRGKLLAGGLVLGCLAAVACLMMAVPVEAVDVSITHTTLEDFNAGYLYHTGLARFDDGEVQLLAQGIAGEWITDTNTTGLPYLARLAAVHHNGHILVLGGQKADGSDSSKVYYTTINTQTHDLANWQTTTDLPKAMFWHTAVEVNDRVYVIGGSDDSYPPNVFDSVYHAPIDPDDGTLGAWQATTPLSTPLRCLQAVVADGRIYVYGGWDESEVPRVPHDEVYVAKPDPVTGVITGWTETEPHAYATAAHMAAVFSNTLYAMGGTHPTEDFVPYVHYATPISATGQISTWTRTAFDMQENLYGGAALGFSGMLYTTGGAQNNAVTPSDYVGTSFINPDGSIGPWLDTSVVWPPRFFHAAVRSVDGWIYVINGSYPAAFAKNPSVNRGSTSGIAQAYAPDGIFISSVMDLRGLNVLRTLNWNTTNSDPDNMGITLWYRSKTGIGAWGPWLGGWDSTAGDNSQPLSGRARFFQYKAQFSTTPPYDQTPLLNEVTLAYETPIYDIGLNKDSVPEPASMVKPGQVVTYTLDYVNGTDGFTITNAYILDYVPEYATYKAASIFGKGASLVGERQLRWDLDTLYVGDGGQVGFSVVISDQIYEEVTLQNRATIFSQNEYGYDNPARSSNRVTHTIDPGDFQVDVDKDAVPGPGTVVKPGQVVQYTLTYLNDSGGMVTPGTYILDDVPEYATYVAGSIFGTGATVVTDRQLRWDLGTLDPGDGGQVGFSVVVDQEIYEELTLSNQAFITSAVGLGMDSNLVTHIIEPFIFRIDVDKDAVPAPGSFVEPGDQIAYTISYHNSGEIPAAQATLTDTYKPETDLTISSAVPDNGGGSLWNLGPLPLGKQDEVQLVIDIANTVFPKNWPITNQASVGTPGYPVQYSPVVTHYVNEPGRLYPDLVVEDIRWEPADPIAGMPVEFYVTIASQGDLDADVPFWLEFYIRPASAGAPDGPSDHDQGYCLNNCADTRADYVQSISSMAVGSRFEVPFQSADMVFDAMGDYDVYAQVDVAFEGPEYHPYWGVYPESDEKNNLRHEVVQVAPPRVYLPHIKRNGW
jgi:uncharacterized repeat protein (TIGR01451 family)